MEVVEVAVASSPAPTLAAGKLGGTFGEASFEVFRERGARVLVRRGERLRRSSGAFLRGESPRGSRRVRRARLRRCQTPTRVRAHRFDVPRYRARFLAHSRGHIHRVKPRHRRRRDHRGLVFICRSTIREIVSPRGDGLGARDERGETFGRQSLWWVSAFGPRWRRGGRRASGLGSRRRGNDPRNRRVDVDDEFVGDGSLRRGRGPSPSENAAAMDAFRRGVLAEDGKRARVRGIGRASLGGSSRRRRRRRRRRTGRTSTDFGLRRMGRRLAGSRSRARGRGRGWIFVLDGLLLKRGVVVFVASVVGGAVGGVLRDESPGRDGRGRGGGHGLASSRHRDEGDGAALAVAARGRGRGRGGGRHREGLVGGIVAEVVVVHLLGDLGALGRRRHRVGTRCNHTPRRRTRGGGDGRARGGRSRRRARNPRCSRYARNRGSAARASGCASPAGKTRLGEGVGTSLC